MRRCFWLFASLAVVVSLVPSVPAVAENAVQQPQPVKYVLKGKEISKNAYDALMLFNQSFEPMQKGDYAKTAEKLQAALVLDPNLYQAHTNLGFMLARLGRPDEGIAELKRAIEIDPGRPEAVTTIASLYQATGKLGEAISHYKEALHRYPNSPMSANIASVVKQLEQEYKRDQAIAKSLQPGENADDYFAHATWDSVAKWPTSKLPLKLYVPSDQEAGHVAKFRPEFNQALRDAFAEWANASEGAVKFEFVNSIKDADIDVLWTSDQTKVSRPSEGGEARVAYDTTNGINHVQIILLTKTPDVTDQFVPLNIIKGACLHEIGHSLGILGHSPDPKDVMFCSVPAADETRSLTSRDGKTLAHLYRNDVKMAHHFHDVADANDKISLNNEGVNYAGAQQFAKAADRFEASLKLDPNYEPAKQNLSACLNNLAIEMAKNGKYAEAAVKFKRAIDLQNNSKDKGKLATTMRNYAFCLSRLNRTAEAHAIKAAADKLASETAVTSLKK